ncbi:transposase [Streptomyces prasinus]|uniref:transposase n=1 Tax=Streptomyces prasinus TaxID=67345 RepID=UPI0036271F95
MAAVRADLSKRLVPDELWELVAPLLPLCAARPQGGGTAPRDERTVFAAVAYILTSGCAWRYLPESFGVSPATAHRRFSVWTEAGLWRRLHWAAAGSSGRAADAFLALKASTHSPAAQATSDSSRVQRRPRARAYPARNRSVSATVAGRFSGPPAGKTAAASPASAASGRATVLSQSCTTCSSSPFQRMFWDSKSPCPTTSGRAARRSRVRTRRAVSSNRPGPGWSLRSTSMPSGHGQSRGPSWSHPFHGGAGANDGTSATDGAAAVRRASAAANSSGASGRGGSTVPPGTRASASPPRTGAVDRSAGDRRRPASKPGSARCRAPSIPVERDTAGAGALGVARGVRTDPPPATGPLRP